MTPPIQEGLLLVQFQDFSGEIKDEVLYARLYSEEGSWAEVRNLKIGNSWWAQKPVYEKDTDLVPCQRIGEDRELEDKVGYALHVEYIGYFKDLEAFRKFLDFHMKATILDEHWEAVA